MKTLFTMNRKRDIVLAFILALFIISFAVCLTVFFKPIYYLDIDLLNITELTDLTKEALIKNYNILIDYQSIFYQGELTLPDFIMSTTGRIHFEEVKRIFEVIQYLCMITGIVSAFMIYQNYKQKEYRYLKLTSILTIAIPSIIGLLASIDFDKAFVIFHKIFFNNDYWIFDITSDPVILALPQDFFMHCFMMIICVILVFSFICYFIYRRKEKQILENEKAIG